MLSKMPDQNVDVVVVGGGPGGYVAAIRAAQLGMKTIIVERDKLGGICLNWGCIPTKALLKNAEIYTEFKHAEEWGIRYDNLTFDFAKIIARSRKVATLNSKGVEYLMKKNKIETISGFGKLAGNGKVEISRDGKPAGSVTAKHVIIATGARARSLPGVAIDGTSVISSTEAMVLPAVPGSMLIIGAGAIGVEFAYFYNAFGTKVTLVEMMPNILPVEDKELSKLLESNFRKKGIEILTETKVEKVVKGKEVKVTVSGKEGSKELKGDVALMAIGVQANSEDLGLEKAGVKTEKG